MHLWGRVLPGQHGRVEDVPATAMQQDQQRIAQFQDLGERNMRKGLEIVKGVRSDPKYLGRGDCYEANLELAIEMGECGYYPKLCHGILTAADFYTHMEPGTLFMHAWVEVKHDIHGWTVCDASLCAGTEIPFTMHDRKLFYSQLKPNAVVAMPWNFAIMCAERFGRANRWDLHPDHYQEGIL